MSLLVTESKATLRLALPLIVGQLSQMLMQVVDTVMLGHVGVTDLAALTFANTLFHIPLVLGIGLLSSIAVVTSNARGKGDDAAARACCRHGLQIALLLGVLITIAAVALVPFLGHFGQPEAVVRRVPVFFITIMASLIPALAMMALKNHGDALDHPWPSFWISIASVGLNIVLNYIFIYGNFGFPALGLEGAALGTLLARCAGVAAIIVWFKRSKALANQIPRRWFAKPVATEWKRLLALGLPSSIASLAEVMSFSVAGLMIGRFGETALAAHQIALTCGGTAFMIPLGLSMALTVRAGEASGANDRPRVKAIVHSAWIVTTCIMLATAAIFVFGGDLLAKAYIKNADVIALATKLLVIAGIFQLFDGLQVASAGLLRGMQDVRFPAVMGIISYWVLAIPTGIFLAFPQGWGAQGMWTGLAIGLGAAAVGLGMRLRWRLRQAY